jgi:hypothetical protein
MVLLLSYSLSHYHRDNAFRLDVTIKARAHVENEIVAENCIPSLLAGFDMILRIGAQSYPSA